LVIERVPRLTRAEFADRFLRRGPPVVISDDLAHWSGTTAWTFDELRARWGERPVRAAVTAGGEWTYESDRQTVPFSALIDAVVAPKPDAHRLSGPQLRFRDHPWAAEGVGIPRVIPEGRTVTSNLWLQAAGDKTHLHCDGKPGILGLLSGEKEIALYSPDDWRSLYPSSAAGGEHWSRVDFWRPDASQFPRFRDAQPLRVTLRAGEMLFVPVTWWHCVHTTQPSIALNCWWPEPDAEIADVYRHLWGFGAAATD
jgi:hypothetical protein